MDLYTLDPTADQRETLVQNILAVLASATSEQLQRGKSWYQTAHDLAVLIGGDAKVGAGLLAALSAQRQWAETVKLSFLAAQKQHVATLADQQRKISLIMGGKDPAEVLPMARKTGQFYLCILNPNNPVAVVIDRHAYSIAVGEFIGSENPGLSTLKRYDIFAHAYRVAAQRVGLTPATLQAVTWVVWTEKLDNELGVHHRGWSAETRSA